VHGKNARGVKKLSHIKRPHNQGEKHSEVEFPCRSAARLLKIKKRFVNANLNVDSSSVLVQIRLDLEGCSTAHRQIRRATWDTVLRAGWSAARRINSDMGTRRFWLGRLPGK